MSSRTADGAKLLSSNLMLTDISSYEMYKSSKPYHNSREDVFLL